MAFSAVVIGIGSAVVGGATSLYGSSQASDAQKGIAQQEQKAEAQRHQAMVLDANRKSLEVMRNSQKANALALTNATAQGAGASSGLQGGYGQIAGASGFNLLGIAQNLATGNNLFDINQSISGYKQDLADAQSWSTLGSGLTSFGTSMIGASGSIGNLSGIGGGGSAGYYGGSPANNPNLVPYSNPGNTSMYGIY